MHVFQHFVSTKQKKKERKNTHTGEYNNGILGVLSWVFSVNFFCEFGNDCFCWWMYITTLTYSYSRVYPLFSACSVSRCAPFRSKLQTSLVVSLYHIGRRRYVRPVTCYNRFEMSSFLGVGVQAERPGGADVYFKGVTRLTRYACK